MNPYLRLSGQRHTKNRDHWRLLCSALYGPAIGLTNDPTSLPPRQVRDALRRLQNGWRDAGSRDPNLGRPEYAQRAAKRLGFCSPTGLTFWRRQTLQSPWKRVGPSGRCKTRYCPFCQARRMLAAWKALQPLQAAHSRILVGLTPVGSAADVQAAQLAVQKRVREWYGGPRLTYWRLVLVPTGWQLECYVLHLDPPKKRKNTGVLPAPFTTHVDQWQPWDSQICENFVRSAGKLACRFDNPSLAHRLREIAERRSLLGWSRVWTLQGAADSGR